jgi:rhodanese-related sulfurtransferase
MNRTMSPADVRRALLLREEIALVDLREEASFALAHPLFAAQLPLSRLEIDVLDRIPRLSTLVVLYDDGEGLIDTAAERLAAIGYSDVRRLEGGLQGWADAGFELFQDVNSYSKAFGELVEARRHTPSLPAEAVQARIDAGDDMVVLDARRFDEYRTMSIPTAVSVPGAELVLRVRELAPDPSTTVVVNCAGRTRSLIGAQSLINAGLPNPVVALRNGAIGWTLAGQALDRGAERTFGAVSAATLDLARRDARSVAYRAGVRRLDLEGLRHAEADTRRTLYRFDVRTPTEYAAGHIAGFRSAPGGQLVQETDMFAPVRGARIVLADDLGPRADMTASWLAQMGWEVLVLDGGFEGPLETGPWRPALPPAPTAAMIEAAELARLIDEGQAAVVDLAPSAVYRRGHIPGSLFAIRARLAHTVGDLPRGALVLTSPDGILAAFAARELEALSGRPVRVLAGGTQAWSAAGHALASGFERAISPPDDIYKRPYEGVDHAQEAMQAYLDWEYGLVEQLARDGTHGFFVI